MTIPAPLEPALPPPTTAPATAPALTDMGVWGWTLLAMAFAALDLSLHLFRNWVSFDEGAMGLAASLVRHGYWPHRDFTDVYSGGLAIFDAGAQWLFGDDLIALRIPLGIASILWVGLLAACFRRFVTPAAAAGLALVAFLWGPPLYTAAMPSWYLLFLATAVTWCLLRWSETREPRWWGAVGLLIGLALFIKINALFLLAGAGCVLLTDDRHRGGMVAGLLVLLGVAGACLTVGSGWPWTHAATLTAPLVALAAAAVWHQQRTHGSEAADLRHFFVLGAWLALGIAIVVVPWILAYALHGGLQELIHGLFVLPFRRPDSARLMPPPFRLLDLLPIALLPVLLFVKWERRWALSVAVVVVGLAFFATEVANLHPVAGVRFIWRVVRGWAAIVPLMIAVVRYRELGPQARSILIVGWIAAWFALLQYPFAAPNYLAYVGPLILLAGVAATSLKGSRPVGAAVAAALAIWTLGVDHGQPLSLLGFNHASPPPQLAALEVRHGGGLMVPEWDARIMKATVDLLDHWGARTIVAGPDAPQVYYFSDRPFPDREFFEFMAPEWSAAVMAERIRSHDPDAVVLNMYTYFSKIDVDSVLNSLPRVPIADSTIGPFRMLLLRPAHASP